jgi:ribose transport system permease protein
MIVVLTAGIDLSVGGIVTLVNTVIIMMLNQYHLPLAVTFVAAIVIGLIVGSINGFVVAYLKIPPLLATFATMSIFSGLALMVLPKPGGTVPTAMYEIYGKTTLFIPNSLFIIALMVVIWAVITRYPLGKYLRAVGGNARNAYIAGVNVSTIKFSAYVLSGLMAAVAGICITAQTASGDPNIGAALTLNSVAAVILGGTRLSGGWGKIGGTLAGALFLGVVNNIVFFFFNNYMTHFKFIETNSSFIQQLLTNTIIILGLASSVITQRKKRVGLQ